MTTPYTLGPWLDLGPCDARTHADGRTGTIAHHIAGDGGLFGWYAVSPTGEDCCGFAESTAEARVCADEAARKMGAVLT